ncbi:MAG: YggT family protein [Epulopiscium sp.]|nr:YggT family protein [Candidatus Epulonipiscium sp.]
MYLSSILSSALTVFFNLLDMLIFVRVLLSWFPVSRSNPLVALIYQLTEPILGPVRALIQRSVLGGRGMMLDFSPIIALLLLEFIKNILMYLTTLI